MNINHLRYWVKPIKVGRMEEIEGIPQQLQSQA